MSHSSATPSHERATEEATAGINVKLIVGVGVFSLAIFAVSAWVAYLLLIGDLKELKAERGMPAERTLIGKAEIGIVDNVPFDIDQRLAVWKAKMNETLNGYGWADREKGLVRIPIDEAVKKVISENNHEAVEMKPLAWPTAPTAPGTLEMVIRRLKPATTAPASGKDKEGAKP